MSDLDGVPGAEERTQEVASIGQRVAGALIDGLLISMVVVIPLLLGFVTWERLERDVPESIVLGLFSFSAIYTIVPTAIWGQTAGKLAVGARVVTVADGSVPGWWRSVMRWTLPGLAGRLPYVGLWVSVVIIATVIGDPRRRGLHDRLAGTIVLRVPR